MTVQAITAARVLMAVSQALAEIDSAEIRPGSYNPHRINAAVGYLRKLIDDVPPELRELVAAARVLVEETEDEDENKHAHAGGDPARLLAALGPFDWIEA